MCWNYIFQVLKKEKMNTAHPSYAQIVFGCQSDVGQSLSLNFMPKSYTNVYNLFLMDKANKWPIGGIWSNMWFYWGIFWMHIFGCIMDACCRISLLELNFHLKKKIHQYFWLRILQDLEYLLWFKLIDLINFMQLKTFGGGGAMGHFD